MTDLPEPLTPLECDLRGYEYMPLFGQRMFGSRFYSLSLRNPRAGLAALKLWWEAWMQCPAGSLPDDDFDLARMADFGADLKAWRAVKQIALHGFVSCSDGRLYHPHLCDHAIKAWEGRRKERFRKAEQRAKKAASSDVPSQDVPPSVHSVSHGTGVGTDRGTDEGQDAAVRSEVKVKVSKGKKEEPPVTPLGPKSSVAASRGSRLTDEWEPDRDFASALGLDAATVLAGFRDYWRSAPGARGRKADWQATWRNWCRKEAERLPLAKPNRAAESRQKLQRYLADIAETEAETEPRTLLQ